MTTSPHTRRALVHPEDLPDVRGAQLLPLPQGRLGHVTERLGGRDSVHGVQLGEGVVLVMEERVEVVGDVLLQFILPTALVEFHRFAFN